MDKFKTSDVVLCHRIAAASTGADIHDIRQDLPKDRVTQALINALAVALEDVRDHEELVTSLRRGAGL